MNPRFKVILVGCTALLVLNCACYFILSLQLLIYSLVQSMGQWISHPHLEMDNLPHTLLPPQVSTTNAFVISKLMCTVTIIDTN